MKKETARTLAIIVGVVILFAIIGLGSALWLFTSSFNRETVDAAGAAQRFEEIRKRFVGITPVLDIRDDEAVVTRRPAAGSQSTRLTTMHVVAWDADDDELVQIDLPFWLLRLKSGPIEIASDHTSVGDNDLGITVEDLERYGPTLVLDHGRRRRGHVLIWTE
jgi:hypothetical protein